MSLNEEEYKRGWGRGWVVGSKGEIVWTNPDLNLKPSRTPVIDELEGKPANTLGSSRKRRVRDPSDRSLTEMVSGGGGS